jgi:hypothetical protein
MTTSHKHRLDVLESVITTPETGFTPEQARARVAILRAEGRELDLSPTEFGGLFSPAQLCRMVDLQSTKR